MTMVLQYPVCLLISMVSGSYTHPNQGTPRSGAWVRAPDHPGRGLVRYEKDAPDILKSVSMDAPRPFFAGKSFYTTAANRMARHLLPNAVTLEDIIVACGGEVPGRQLPKRPEKIAIEPPEACSSAKASSTEKDFR